MVAYHEPFSESPLNPFDLTGRVAIVTGGNGGLGLAIARGFARAGASIALAARDESKGQVAVKELIASAPKTRFYAFEASSASSCRKLIETVIRDFGACDILVNSAGMNRRKPPEQISEQEWHEILAVNLGAALFCAQAAYPHMKAAGRGKILNIGSMYSLFGAATVAAYAASKGGLLQLTRSLACAWAADNIQVNALLPGWIDTELTRRARQQVAELHEFVLARTPAGMGRARRSRGSGGIFVQSGSGFRHRRGAAGRWRLFGTRLSYLRSSSAVPCFTISGSAARARTANNHGKTTFR
jgi:2-deoxy-D-gluconate 3-dehydrogenase